MIDNFMHMIEDFMPMIEDFMPMIDDSYRHTLSSLFSLSPSIEANHFIACLLSLYYLASSSI
jgi:hypothetical protein